MKRRFFLFAAPAIVAAPSLMKISALAMPPRANFWDIRYAPEWLTSPIDLSRNGIYARYTGYGVVSLSSSDMVWHAAHEDAALVNNISGIFDVMRGTQST